MVVMCYSSLSKLFLGVLKMATVKTVKYSEFLNTVGFVGVPVSITQKGENGYTLSATYTKGEEENLLLMGESMVIKGQELQQKMFKSLNTIVDILRSAGILAFTVSLETNEISKDIRPVLTEEEKAKRAKEK